jgi:hypothetical protein
MQVGTEVWVKNTHLDLFNNDVWLPATVKCKVYVETVSQLVGTLLIYLFVYFPLRFQMLLVIRS